MDSDRGGVSNLCIVRPVRGAGIQLIRCLMFGLFDVFHYVHWRIPFTDITIFETMILDEEVAILRALCVVVPLLLISVAWQRWSDRIDSERRRYGDEP